MTPQPLLGLLFHALGGAAAASFYAPLKFIRRWPWECFYLAMGAFAWLATPWIFAAATTPDLLGVIAGSPPAALGWTLLFGVLWGIGAVTFGLSMRYLGMALGMSVALGSRRPRSVGVDPAGVNLFAFIGGGRTPRAPRWCFRPVARRLSGDESASGGRHSGRHCRGRHSRRFVGRWRRGRSPWS